MEQDRPNQAANKEPAEGSRENAGASDNAGGITNRPLDREEKEQEQVPPRGEAKHEDAGRTSGGGSLGHDQPDDVRREAPIRNS